MDEYGHSINHLNQLQLNHYNTTFKKHKFPIVLVSENVTNAPNIGSIFRISDTFGIDKVILCVKIFL
tara:strand:+ start:17233 stop:17433 length:201 start_codon:yes stop_codon:yes gene_type:complete